MNSSQDKIDVYQKIADVLRWASENDESKEAVYRRADYRLPRYEADLMRALFEEFEDQVWKEKMAFNANDEMQMETDLYESGYHGKSMEDYEQDRKEALKDILSLSETDSLAAVKKFYEAAGPLREAAKGTAYNWLAHKSAIILTYIEASARLLKNGKLSLTEIVDCLPGVQMHDLYGLAQKLQIPVQATDEEMERIHKEKEEKERRQFKSMKDIMDYVNQLEPREGES